jgi:hypothetical protein
VTSIAVSPDGRFLVTGTDNGGVFLGNVAQRTKVATLQAPVPALTAKP